MGQSCRRMCCCCCKKKGEEEKPLLDEEAVTGMGGDHQVAADKLIAKSLHKYRIDKDKKSPSADPNLDPVEQGVTRYKKRAARAD